MKVEKPQVTLLTGTTPVRVLKSIKVGNKISDFEGNTGIVKSIELIHFTNQVDFLFKLRDDKVIQIIKRHPNPAVTKDDLTRYYYNRGLFIDYFNKVENDMGSIISAHFVKGLEDEKRFKLTILKRLDAETKKNILQDIFKDETFKTNGNGSEYFKNIISLIVQSQIHRNVMSHNHITYTDYQDMKKQAFALDDIKNPTIAIKYYLEDFIGYYEDLLYLVRELPTIYKSNHKDI